MNCHRRKKFENKDKEKDHGAGFREKGWGGGRGGGVSSLTVRLIFADKY